MLDYKVERGSEERMQRVDALSRRRSILAVHDPLTDRLQRAQEHGASLQAVRALLKLGPFQNLFYQMESSSKETVPRRNLSYLEPCKKRLYRELTNLTTSG